MYTFKDSARKLFCVSCFVHSSTIFQFNFLTLRLFGNGNEDSVIMYYVYAICNLYGKTDETTVFSLNFMDMQSSARIRNPLFVNYLVELFSFDKVFTL